MKDDARRGVALALPLDVAEAVAVIAAETGKGQRAVLADLATEAAPFLMLSLTALCGNYERERKARINKALGKAIDPEAIEKAANLGRPIPDPEDLAADVAARGADR